MLWRMVQHPGRDVEDIQTLKLTQPLKMDSWKTSFLLGWPIFTGYSSFREGMFSALVLGYITFVLLAKLVA